MGGRRKFKIVMVHNRYQEPGGEDVVFDAEKTLLERMNHEVIAVIEDNANLRGKNPIKVALNAIWSVETQRYVDKLIKEQKPDIAHIHNTFLRISPAIYYAFREAGVPVVQTLHNFRLICPGALLMRDGRVCEDCVGKVVPWPGVIHGCWRSSRAQTAVMAGVLTVHRFLGTWADTVDVYIALTDFARHKFIEGGLPAEKIVVKPNFVHPDPGPGEHGGGYALFVGRLSQEKGLRTLLRAWERLRGIPLKIVGDGPLAAEVYKSHSEEIKILGWKSRSEVLTMMKEARFLVFPSESYETFGMTIIEAFASGLPVLASRLGAMAEIVEDGRTGLLFEPRNPEDLAEKVAWAWAHPKTLAEMGLEARREFEEKYTAERNYQILMAIYEKLRS